MSFDTYKILSKSSNLWLTLVRRKRITSAKTMAGESTAMSTVDPMLRRAFLYIATATSQDLQELTSQKLRVHARQSTVQTTIASSDVSFPFFSCVFCPILANICVRGHVSLLCHFRTGSTLPLKKTDANSFCLSVEDRASDGKILHRRVQR